MTQDEMIDVIVNNATETHMAGVRNIVENVGIENIDIPSVAAGMKIARDGIKELLKAVMMLSDNEDTIRTLKILVQGVDKLPIVGEE